MSNSQLVFVWHVGQTAYKGNVYQLIFLEDTVNCDELEVEGWDETPAALADLGVPFDGVAKQLFVVCDFELTVVHKSNQNSMNDAKDGVIALAWMPTPDENGLRLVLNYKMTYAEAVKRLRFFATKIIEYI